jgi:hypothetical protein
MTDSKRPRRCVFGNRKEHSVRRANALFHVRFDLGDAETLFRLTGSSGCRKLKKRRTRGLTPEVLAKTLLREEL